MSSIEESGASFAVPIVISWARIDDSRSAALGTLEVIN
jgi:hypothetical protein